MEQIPYVAFESALARLERTNRRLFILCVILILLLLATNMGWLYYESQFSTTESTEVSQDIDTGNGDAFVAGIGDVVYGESETESNQN
jgi:hypothetical protein